MRIFYRDEIDERFKDKFNLNLDGIFSLLKRYFKRTSIEYYSFDKPLGRVKGGYLGDFITIVHYRDMIQIIFHDFRLETQTTIDDISEFSVRKYPIFSRILIPNTLNYVMINNENIDEFLRPLEYSNEEFELYWRMQ